MALLFACGLVLLPPAIFFVGQQVVGEYAPNGELFDLVFAIWGDLATPSAAAWLLVLSPYIVIQLLRFSKRQWRGPRPAPKSVNES